jgi:type II secretory pathway pseudopilin PulG
LALIFLGAITLITVPYLLSSRSKPTYSAEAKHIVGAMNRAQQAYYLEKGSFTDSIPKLGLGITNPTEGYQYSIEKFPDGGEKFPVAIFNYGVPRVRYLKSYIGVVVLLAPDAPEPNSITNTITTKTLLCESQDPEVKPFEPIVENGVIKCHPSLQDLENTQGILVGEDWQQASQALQLAGLGKYELAEQLAKSLKNPFYQKLVLEAIAPPSAPPTNGEN